LRGKPAAPDLNLEALAAAMGGMSGAQIAGVANSAAYLASRAGRSQVEQADLLAAVEQAKYGNRMYDAHRCEAGAAAAGGAASRGWHLLAARRASLLPPAGSWARSDGVASR
jgi:hypothetical protein